MEEWKVYPEVSNYEVSSLGKIRNIKTGRVLANNVDKDGYFYVGLYQDKKKYRRNIHRLVALTFIPNPDNLPIVDHINQDRQDNRVENLRWTTHKGNSRNTKFNSKVKICDFEGNVIPNYTTNGIILSDFYNREDSERRKLAQKLIAYTKHFVGGVAVSFGNKHIRDKARLAINALRGYGHVNINIHHIISTKESVDEFVEEWLKYDDEILYHVLLPLMPAGRSTKGVDEGVFEYLEEVIEKNNIKNVAFGAHFIKNLRDSKIKTLLYDEESFSKNIILEKNCVKITPSSFDLNPIKIINL